MRVRLSRLKKEVKSISRREEMLVEWLRDLGALSEFARTLPAPTDELGKGSEGLDAQRSNNY